MHSEWFYGWSDVTRCTFCPQDKMELMGDAAMAQREGPQSARAQSGSFGKGSHSLAATRVRKQRTYKNFKTFECSKLHLFKLYVWKISLNDIYLISWIHKCVCNSLYTHILYIHTRANFSNNEQYQQLQKYVLCYISPDHNSWLNYCKRTDCY